MSASCSDARLLPTAVAFAGALPSDSSTAFLRRCCLRNDADMPDTLRAALLAADELRVRSARFDSEYLHALVTGAAPRFAAEPWFTRDFVLSLLSESLAATPPSTRRVRSALGLCQRFPAADHIQPILDWLREPRSRAEEVPLVSAALDVLQSCLSVAPIETQGACQVACGSRFAHLSPGSSVEGGTQALNSLA